MISGGENPRSQRPSWCEIIYCFPGGLAYPAQVPRGIVEEVSHGKAAGEQEGARGQKASKGSGTSKEHWPPVT